MQREMAEHLDRATDRLVTRGLSPDDARNAAIREFGNVTYLKEEGRQARGTRWLDALASDSRFAIRHFRRNPGATLTMLIVLAIGMSFSTALFSLMHAYATQRPPGVTASGDLVRIRGWQQTPGYDRSLLRLLTRAELEEYQGLTSHFEAVAGYATDRVTIGGDGDRGSAESGKATFVTPDYFDLLGVRPVIGAGLPRAESATGGSELVAVIGYAVWEKFFGRSPDVLGATLTVDGVPVTIVGVAPPRFGGLARFDPMMVWMSIASRRLVLTGLDPAAESFAAVGRLAPGTDYERATAAAQVIAQRATVARDQERPAAKRRRTGADVVNLLAMNADPVFDREPFNMSIGFSLLGTLVLLITCTNVSALQTGLAMMRRREVAIRLAMGAGRRRIIRQLLTETVILATLAAGAGLALVWLFQRLVIAGLSDLPLALEVSGPALAFAFGLALAVGTLFGLSPALHATRITVSSALKDSTSAIAAPRVRLQRGLIIAQVTLTQPLIVGLGLMLVHLFGSYKEMGLNQSAERIVSMRLRPAEAPSANGGTRQWAGEMRALRDRMRSSPSIEGAVQDPEWEIVLDGYRVETDARADSAAEQPLWFYGKMVAPGYFTVIGERLLLGRDFTERDVTPPPGSTRAEIPVVIGSDLAADLWPNANPLGRRLESAVEGGDGRPLTVVGVVEQARDASGLGSGEYEIFIPPDSARLNTSLVMLIRTSGPARALVPTIRLLVQEATPRLAVADARTMADLELEARDLFKLAVTGLGAAGFLILFLAAIGLYAVVSFAVGQRTSEIAVRMAVGAGQRQIMRKFVGEGVRLGIIGLIIGLPLSLIALRILMTTMNEEISTVSIGGVAGAAGIIVLTVALAATWVPARRAAGVDPAVVLRRD
jgi:predicted permease